ncbi:MAG: ABC transporter permease [Firmicutes bacterium]|nr:ABC transporter permease [Bacillota bacterium]
MFLLNFLLLEFKNVFKNILYSFWGFGVCAAVIVAAALGIAFFSGGDVKQIASVAIAIPEGKSDESELIFSLVNGMDSVSQVCRVESLSYEEADKGFKEDKYIAVVYLSDNFVRDVYNGVNTTVKIRLKNSAMGTEIFKELVESGVSMIDTTEASVYAASDENLGIETKMSQRDIQKLLTGKFFDAIFTRSSFYKNEEMKGYDNMTKNEFYFLGALMSLLLVFILNFSGTYEDKTRAVTENFTFKKVGSLGINTVKVLVRGFYLYVFLWLVLFLFVKIASIQGKDNIQLQRFLLNFNIKYILFILPVLSLTAFFHLIYTFFENKSNGETVVFFLIVVLLVGGGLFIPKTQMPALVAKVSDFLPISVWKEGIKNGLYNTFDGKNMLYQGLIALFALIFSCFARRKRV